VNVTVYNLLGEQIYESKVRENVKEVDLQDRSKGIYILKMETGTDSHYERIELK
jgi:hypothetical protein